MVWSDLGKISESGSPQDYAWSPWTEKTWWGYSKWCIKSRTRPSDLTCVHTYKCTRWHPCELSENGDLLGTHVFSWTLLLSSPIPLQALAHSRNSLNSLLNGNGRDSVSGMIEFQVIFPCLQFFMLLNQLKYMHVSWHYHCDRFIFTIFFNFKIIARDMIWLVGFSESGKIRLLAVNAFRIPLI